MAKQENKKVNKALYIMSVKAEKLLSNVQLDENYNVIDVKIKETTGTTKYYTLEKDIIDKKTGEVKANKGDKKLLGKSTLYSCQLPYSMDVIELEKKYPKEIIQGEKLRYSDAIINVTFKDAPITRPTNEPVLTPKGKHSKRKGELQYKKETLMTSDQVRDKLYNEGFEVDGVKYVEYKRSSSKARGGNTLFIKEELLAHMIEWSRLGLEFEENEKVDIAGLRAYESLSLSAIEDMVTIKPSQIVIIDDRKSFITEMCSVTTKDVGGSIKTENKKITIENDIWDGQCLVDSSIFELAGRKENGMILLRNRFFKGCGFNTNIQGFLKDNGVESVVDMFGNEFAAKDVKMIITPNCLKILKFAYKKGSQKDMYDYWKESISHEFGICKSEKPSRFGEWRNLSYQMINALPLNAEEVNELAIAELNNFSEMQSDNRKFLEYIELKRSDSRSEIFYKAIKEEIPGFLETSEFASWKSTEMSKIKNEIRKGKIRVNGDYATVVGSPYEMLLATIEKFEKVKSHTMQGWEIWCPKFENGIELAGFRNPLIATGNVMCATNKYYDEFRYFNLTPNIAIVNTIGSNVQQRNQGMDQDSDSILLSSNDLLTKSAKECMKYFVPVNQIEADKAPRPLNTQSKSEVDHIIANNQIGSVVNLSQELNSLYFDKMNGLQAISDKDKKVLADIYKYISQLSSLSQLEIDKAKKYVTIDTKAICDDIRKSYTSKPVFMQYVKGNKINKNRGLMKCSMDYLVDVANKNIKKGEDLGIRKIHELLKESVPGSKNEKQIAKIKDIMDEYDTVMRALDVEIGENEFNKEEKARLKSTKMDKEEEYISLISKNKLNEATILTILKRLYNPKSKDEVMSKYGWRLMTAICNLYPENFKKCFKEELAPVVKQPKLIDFNSKKKK